MKDNMKTKSILGIVLMGIICLCMVGCQNDDFMDKTNPLRTAQEGVTTGDTWSLTLEATISDVADTRALELVTEEGQRDVLNGYWEVDEQIGVYLNGAKLGSFEVTEVIEGTNGKSAKLEGTGLSEEGMVDGDNVLTLIYPDNDNVWNYMGQNGTIGAISRTYDYMLASLTVNKSGDDVTYTQTNIEFTNQQSVYRFGFKDGESSIRVKQFTVNSSANTIVKGRTFNRESSDWVSTYGPLTVKPGDPTTSLLYVSILNELAGTANAEDTYEFSVITDDDALYMGTKEITASFFENKSQFNSFKNVAMTQAKLTPNTDTTTDVW